MIYSGLLVVAVLAAYLLQDAVASFAGAALAICGVGPASCVSNCVTRRDR